MARWTARVGEIRRQIGYTAVGLPGTRLLTTAGGADILLGPLVRLKGCALYSLWAGFRCDQLALAYQPENVLR
jgi:hypothetical protein